MNNALMNAIANFNLSGKIPGMQVKNLTAQNDVNLLSSENFGLLFGKFIGSENVQNVQNEISELNPIPTSTSHFDYLTVPTLNFESLAAISEFSQNFDGQVMNVQQVPHLNDIMQKIASYEKANSFFQTLNQNVQVSDSDLVEMTHEPLANVQNLEESFTEPVIVAQNGVVEVNVVHEAVIQNELSQEPKPQEVKLVHLSEQSVESQENSNEIIPNDEMNFDVFSELGEGEMGQEQKMVEQILAPEEISVVEKNVAENPLQQKFVPQNLVSEEMVDDFKSDDFKPNDQELEIQDTRGSNEKIMSENASKNFGKEGNAENSERYEILEVEENSSIKSENGKNFVKEMSKIDGKVKISSAENVALKENIQEQINVNVAKALKNGDEKITIQLKPVELGKIHITIEKNAGTQVITINSEKPETMELLQKDANSLEKILVSKSEFTNLSFGLMNQENKHSPEKAIFQFDEDVKIEEEIITENLIASIENDRLDLVV